MRAAPWVVLVLVLFTGGYMVFDAVYAFATGGYVAPASGALGPWTYVVEAVGIDAEGDVMKVIFIVWGINWSALALLHVHRPDRWWIPLTIWSFASAWYLVVGALFALAAGGILASPWGRPGSSR